MTNLTACSFCPDQKAMSWAVCMCASVCVCVRSSPEWIDRWERNSLTSLSSLIFAPIASSSMLAADRFFTENLCVCMFFVGAFVCPDEDAPASCAGGRRTQWTTTTTDVAPLFSCSIICRLIETAASMVDWAEKAPIMSSDADVKAV